MILCVAPVAYRRATSALESPKGQLPVSVKMSVVVPFRPVHERALRTARGPATREVFSGSA